MAVRLGAPGAGGDSGADRRLGQPAAGRHPRGHARPRTALLLALEYETQLVKDEVIRPGKIGVVVCKIGKPLPEGAYLVDEKGYRGILRKVLTPGRYRINTIWL